MFFVAEPGGKDATWLVLAMGGLPSQRLPICREHQCTYMDAVTAYSADPRSPSGEKFWDYQTWHERGLTRMGAY